MSSWSCGIEACGATFDGVEELLTHQVAAHPPLECEVCGDHVPDGFYAIQHVFSEHTRAKYVRYYDGDSDAIRYRETLIEDVEERVDPAAIRERVEADGRSESDTAVSAGD